MSISTHKTLLYLGNKLSKHGFTPTSVETLAPLLGQHYRVITASNKKNKLLRLADMCAILMRNKHNISLVLIDTYSTSAFMFSRVIGRLCEMFKLPYISILRGGDLPARLAKNDPDDLRFFSRAAALVAPSKYLMHQFNGVQLGQMVFIPNNIKLKDYAFKERNKLSPKLLWVRAFHKTYHCEMAVEVLHQLLKNYPDAELSMIGPDKDGSLELTKQKARELGVLNQVKFTGKLSKTEWHALSERYDIFINTTHVDNTPISVMEALALGLPVVSTNVGGIPFLLNDGENAFLVNDNDTGAMVSSIEQLLKSGELARNFSAKGRALVSQFDWEVVKNQWFELIDRCAKQP